MESNSGLYIVLISIHGLIRGQNPELGRDADTGGQTKYVIELARALGDSPAIKRVDLLTRRVVDPKLDADYARLIEPLSKNARIVRIECGNPGYIAKEELWDSLDNFADNTLKYLNAQEESADLIHSHYADAGYVGSLLSHQLSIPLIHTGHSLGRSKRKRLLASGLKSEDIENRYHISKRVEAEEQTLASADRVITSTYQEIDQQYGLYDYYQPEQMRVVPPGTDLNQFTPADGSETQTSLYTEIARFLNQPDKPVILALSRPDQRKNISTLIDAYGRSDALQAAANLVIIAGNRDDIREMDSGAQDVLTDLLLSIDQYDLYGKVAYPKHHSGDQVPLFYRLAALQKGVFVNPALTEPFGLTLIEAAASGLPIVATEDGGPADIINNCNNGILVDPLNTTAITDALLSIINDKQRWQTFSENGITGVKKHYSWDAHVDKYIDIVKPVLDNSEPVARMCLHRRPMLYHDRAIISDLDQNLLGDAKGLTQFCQMMNANRRCATFGIATGRRLDSALALLREYNIPRPNVLITSLGTEIYYTPNLTRDKAWSEHIDYHWNPRAVRRVLADIAGLRLQPKSEQSAFKVSYYIDPKIAPDIHSLNHMFLKNDQSVHISLSFGQFLDIIPVRASKGLALRWFAEQWEIPLEHMLTAGGSGADEDMMRGNTLAVVVANRHHEELSDLIDIQRIYFAERPFAAGILEAIDHYDFFSSCEVPLQ